MSHTPKFRCPHKKRLMKDEAARIGDRGHHGLRVLERRRQHLHGSGPDTLPHQALPLQAHPLRDPRRDDGRLCHDCRHRPRSIHHLRGIGCAFRQEHIGTNFILSFCHHSAHCETYCNLNFASIFFSSIVFS
jgi:hypothetical protein